MKTTIQVSITRAVTILFLFLVITQGCKKYDDPDNQSSSGDERHAFNYNVVNLVSDVDEYDPLHIDTNLVNAWGMAFGPSGGIWVSAADKGLSTIYNKNGVTLRPPVSIAFNGDPNGGAPTGQVFNPTTSFVIPATSQVSHFIFATENGTIAAWASGDSAITVADRSGQEAVYKGIEMVNNNGTWMLYAADFHNGHVDAFDASFNYVSSSMFSDPTIPAGFAPFNIRKLGNKLFVAYAKQLAPDNEDDEAGPGNGYVNIFNLDGSFVRRFASQGALNSPWGLELLKQNNGFEVETDTTDTSHQIILVGNFGDGHINQYDMNGNLVGPLMSGGQALEIEGLWSISYPPQGNPAYMQDRNRIYFTAGPDDEEHAVFGYISR
jgi:uncharacterized protein (TIGR03118 family)